MAAGEAILDDELAPRLAQQLAEMTGCRVGLVLMKPLQVGNGVARVATGTGFCVGENEDLWLMAAVTGIITSASRRLDQTEPTYEEGEEHRALIRAAAAPLMTAGAPAIEPAERVH